MTRDEAIKVLERAEGYIGIHYINGVEDPYINPCLLKAIDFAVAALREQEERRWIPVTELLPQLIPSRAGTAYSEAVHVLTSDRKVINAVLDSIDSQPTVDAVEVVRCRDCKYWGEHISSYSGDYESFCTNPAGIDNYAYPDDFCSYGERKDGDGNG